MAVLAQTTALMLSLKDAGVFMADLTHNEACSQLQ